MKKVITMLLLSAMLLGSFAACSDNDASSDGTNDNVAGEAGSATDTEVEEETEVEETLDIAVKDYGGRTINIVLAGNWKFDDFIAEEMTGEALNDAKYDTNSAVADLLNVDFAVNNQSGQSSGGSGTGYQLIDNMVMAGTPDYDFADIGCYDVSTLAYKGKLLDLNQIKNIDLTKSWWDQKANEHLSIAGKMYYSTGDAGILDNDCTYCILFNKQMITNFGLDNPYDLVNDNKWVYDKFAAMSDAVYIDMNGNGETDKDDSIGIMMWQDSVIGMLHASGGKFATISDDGVIELTLNTERNIDVLTSWLTLKTQPIVGFIGTSSGITIAESDLENMFNDNRALFYCRYIKAISWFRDMETDFGVLPYPKWDESQQDYCNTMHAYGTSYLCVPITVEDAEMSGAVMEALSYYGQKNITPAYYEKNLKGKYIRDEESSAMLDLIFASRFFDIGAYYQIGGYNEAVITMMQQNNTDFVSMYESKQKLATKTLQKINEAYAEILALDSNP